MRQMLLQNAIAILLQNVTEVYYEMRQFFLLQNATFITNCDRTKSKFVSNKFIFYKSDDSKANPKYIN